MIRTKKLFFEKFAIEHNRIEINSIFDEFETKIKNLSENIVNHYLKNIEKQGIEFFSKTEILLKDKKADLLIFLYHSDEDIKSNYNRAKSFLKKFSIEDNLMPTVCNGFFLRNTIVLYIKVYSKVYTEVIGNKERTKTRLYINYSTDYRKTFLHELTHLFDSEHNNTVNYTYDELKDYNKEYYDLRMIRDNNNGINETLLGLVNELWNSTEFNAYLTGDYKKEYNYYIEELLDVNLDSRRGKEIYDEYKQLSLKEKIGFVLNRFPLRDDDFWNSIKYSIERSEGKDVDVNEYNSSTAKSFRKEYLTKSVKLLETFKERGIKNNYLSDSITDDKVQIRKALFKTIANNNYEFNVKEIKGNNNSNDNYFNILTLKNVKFNYYDLQGNKLVYIDMDIDINYKILRSKLEIMQVRMFDKKNKLDFKVDKGYLHYFELIFKETGLNDNEYFITLEKTAFDRLSEAVYNILYDISKKQNGLT